MKLAARATLAMGYMGGNKNDCSHKTSEKLRSG